MKKNHYILALDQGTSSTRAIIFELTKNKHKVLAQAGIPFKQHYPKQDWVEHDLEEIWDSCLKAIKKAITLCEEKETTFKANHIKALALTNQRETLCVFSKKNGKPLHPAIVWQCKRSINICEDLKKEKNLEEQIRKKTGLFLDPYFTGTKLKWLMTEKESIKKKIVSGEAFIGTIDTYLLYRLTNAKSFFTEPSNASRTLLYNIKEKKWDDELLKIMGDIPITALPEILDSDALFGQTQNLQELPDGIPIHGILGDQQAALFGQKCFDYGESKCTYGTGAFFLMQTKEKCLENQSGLLTTVAWQIKGELSYALEGSCFITGAAVSFLRDNFEIIDHVNKTELKNKVEASPHLYFVPSLCGLGAPWWRAEVKGAFLGLTRSTSKEQMIQACLEGICFQVEDLISVFRKEASLDLKKLSVDGAACANNLLMKTQAHLSNLTLVKPEILETTAYGAALMAAHGCELVSLGHLKTLKNKATFFKPTEQNEKQRQKKLNKGQQAISALKLFHATP